MFMEARTCQYSPNATFSTSTHTHTYACMHELFLCEHPMHPARCVVDESRGTREGGVKLVFCQKVTQISRQNRIYKQKKTIAPRDEK